MTNHAVFKKEAPPTFPCFWKGIQIACGPLAQVPEGEILYRNRGDVTFEDRSSSAGVAEQRGYGFGVVMDYLNDDDRLDIYVANDLTGNFVLMNRGHFAFDDESALSGAAYVEGGREQAGMGVDSGDFDGDGRADIYVTNFSDDYNTLYHNDGDGLFRDATFEARLGPVTFRNLGWGTFFFDYDNDGDEDLFVANGHIYPQATRNSYFDILTSVPGVKASHASNISNFSVYGSNVEQNAFQMDGVDTSSVDEGGAWDYPNYDIIEELQVLGVGVSAEFSGFQGAMINIVTKSGSNELRGSASTYLVSDWMQGNNTPDEEFPAAVDHRRNFNFMLGGPIIKDKLWAIGQYQRSDERDVPVGVELTDDVLARTANKYFFKLNAQLSDNDRLAFTYDDNQFDWPTDPSRIDPIEARPRESGINPVIALRYTHVFNDSTLLEVSGGGIYIRDDWGPMFDDLVTPGRVDVGTGETSVSYRGLWQSHQNKTQVAAALTHYADDFAGSHDFKFGAQFLRSLDRTTMEYNSGVFLYDYDSDYNYYDYVGANYYAAYRAPAAYLGNVDTNSFFVNDNWTVSDRVTLNLGVRYEHMTAGIPDVTIGGVDFQGSDSNLITFHNISPRVGITVGLDSVGKTVAKASYGRYYGKISTDWFKTQATSNAGVDYRGWNADTGKYDIPFGTWDPTANQAVDPNLENQYTDQFYVGFERELIPDLRLDVSFIIKSEANFVRPRDVAGVYEEIPFEDVFHGVSQTLTVFNLVSDPSERLFMSTNRDDFDQSYKSFVIQANKRFSRNWTLNGAYQWQRGFSFADGEIGVESQDFRDQGEAGLGGDPNTLINFRDL